MTCKFTVTCQKCGCRMELTDTNNWEVRGRIVCQNCGKEMPSITFDLFKSAMENIAVIPDNPDGFALAINGDWSANHSG